MPSYSVKSAAKLAQCDLRIQRLFNKIIVNADNSILTGHRNEAEQNEKYYATPQQSKVKWPDSKHNKHPSLAIDATPYPIPPNWGEDHWKDLVKFYEFAAIVRYEAKKMGISIRWGGDWDGDGDYKDQTFDDLVHFELID